jgi:hypothetical protein
VQRSQSTVSLDRQFRIHTFNVLPISSLRESTKTKPILKEKSRQQEMWVLYHSISFNSQLVFSFIRLHDMQMFKLVVNHPVYKQNALSTINTHLRNKLEKEANS